MFDRRAVNRDLGLALDAIRELQNIVVLQGTILVSMQQRITELETHAEAATADVDE